MVAMEEVTVAPVLDWLEISVTVYGNETLYKESPKTGSNRLRTSANASHHHRNEEGEDRKIGFSQGVRTASLTKLRRCREARLVKYSKPEAGIGGGINSQQPLFLTSPFAEQAWLSDAQRSNSEPTRPNGLGGSFASLITKYSPSNVD